MSKEDNDLIESYRYLVASLLTSPLSPSLFEATDLAVYDFLKAKIEDDINLTDPWAIGPCVILRRFKVLSHLGNMTPTEIERYGQTNGRGLDQEEQELLDFKKFLIERRNIYAF